MGLSQPGLVTVAPRKHSSPLWLVPLGFVIAALLGSVVIPAMQSLRILDLLRQAGGLDADKVITVRALEQASLLWNTFLVITAFAALSAVLSMTMRERRVLSEAQEARNKLERVLASRSRLIRGFSHDVKNPIGAADGYAALLAEGVYGPMSAAQLESVEHIRRSIHSALSLIGDLHELASAETGHLAVKKERVNLRAILAELIDEYQAAARAGGLILEGQLDDYLAPAWTSEVRVQQIMSNLLSNAIKYTPRGSVTVETRMSYRGPAGKRGAWIRIDVTDTGPGIPADKQEFIFEEFSRIGTHEKLGAGLGLAISRLLAGALGGHITLDSEVGRGSCFTLWLPGGTENEMPDAVGVGRVEAGAPPSSG